MRKDYVATGYIFRKIRDGFELLMVKHSRYGKWITPGGHLRPGEPPSEGVIREVKEETGLICKIIDLNFFTHKASYSFLNSAIDILPAPYCIAYEQVPAHIEGVDHIHIDFSFLMRTDSPNDSLAIDNKEIIDAKWLDIDLIEFQNTFENIISITKSLRQEILSYEIIL